MSKDQQTEIALLMERMYDVNETHHLYANKMQHK